MIKKVKNKGIYIFTSKRFNVLAIRTIFQILLPKKILSNIFFDLLFKKFAS